MHRRILNILNVALFCLTLVWMLVGFMFWSQPDEVLAGENRRMASLPPLTFDAMFGGAYSNAVEEYIADHFPMRDKWVTVHATIRDLLGVRSDDGTFYDVEVNEGEFAKTPVAVEEVPDDFVTEEMPDELAAQEGQADPYADAEDAQHDAEGDSLESRTKRARRAQPVIGCDKGRIDRYQDRQDHVGNCSERFD